MASFLSGLLFGKRYQNVAWMGGSYAPPTRMHVQVAMEMGDALLARTDVGKRCAVCIVPVNKNYNKRSVKEACISDDVRRALIKAFVAAVTKDFAGRPRAKDCDFLYMEYELNSAGPVATIDSLTMLNKEGVTAENYFIAQGQDNVLAIMERKWTKSDKLLEDYGFFMYPRGSVAGLEAQMMTAMMNSETGKSKGIGPLTEEKARAVIDKVIVVGAGFNDDTSSSGVRAALRAGDIEIVKGSMHPDVFKLMASIATTGSSVWPYSSRECDDVPEGVGGGGGGGAAAGGAAAGGAGFMATFGGRRKKRMTRRSKRRSRKTRR